LLYVQPAATLVGVAPPIPDEVPVAFTAGVTVKFRRAFNDYPPADGWTYKIYFNGATDVFNSRAVVDPGPRPGGSSRINPADRQSDPGLYRYVERVSSSGGGEVYDVGEGVVQIEPDLATAPAGASLSFAERTLAQIEAEIAARIVADVEDYTASRPRHWAAAAASRRSRCSSCRSCAAITPLWSVAQEKSRQNRRAGAG
jgi:hypothetical protein